MPSGDLDSETEITSLQELLGLTNLSNCDGDTQSIMQQLGEIIGMLAQAVVTDANPSRFDTNPTDLFDRLSHAAQLGNKSLFQKLVEAEAQTRHPNQPTLLMAAVLAERVDLVRELVAAGADVNVRIQRFFTFDAMQFAADQEMLEIVKILADAGADLNWNDPGFRPLKKAIDKGNVEMLQILLDAGAEITFATGFNPLVEAASKTNTPEIIQLLLNAGCDVNGTNRGGDTALVNACLHGYDAVVHTLLTAGADANQSRKDGVSPLLAVFSAPQMNQALSSWGLAGDGAGLLSRMTTIVQTLVAAGANPNTCDFQGRTALMLAAEKGYLDIATILLANGADVNAIADPAKGFIPDLLKGVADAIAQSSDQKTALLYATDNGHTGIVQALLDAGADVAIADKQGRTARDIAIQQGFTAIVRLLEQAGNQALEDSPQFTDAFLLGAAKQGNLEDLRSALQAGVSPNAVELQERRNPRYKTALMFAAERGHLEAVRILVEAGAETNLSDRPGKKLGKTPLMYAAEAGHANIVRLLLEAGATVDAQDKRGETALFLAVQQNCVEVVRVLLEYGADPHKKSWD
ncbi:ankyrin repeat domain-containing protein [Oscillatoria sp. FACHB-1407]|uniref:ankyrin repeat domain-containing protein n=1 Tax=Oscillatoria sp. FACHB-1407 TaxID=2692847 RepID=UPI00168798AF|nr:ankyrin repeat domain-containing protein [Oscillatoria sp. FACHB-1407]MBD2462459.1 ankyrin repeat domain-containing protein [Oscillatoria sp. FACHB-1407]